MSGKQSDRPGRAETGRFFTNPRTIAEMKEIIRLALIGLSVTKGAKRPRSRRHDLGELIEETFAALVALGHEPTSTEVLNAIKQDEEIVQEIVGDMIYWKDWRGREYKMKMGTFRNRVSKIRQSRASS